MKWLGFLVGAVHFGQRMMQNCGCGDVFLAMRIYIFGSDHSI